MTPYIGNHYIRDAGEMVGNVPSRTVAFFATVSPPESLDCAMSTRLNAWTSALCVVAAIGVSLAAEPTSPAQAGAIPDRLTNQEFWQLVTTLEEKGGTYHSDNFTSNEPGLAQTAADVADRIKGGAYLGVGPEQNFSYIVAIQPTIAFIVDIRRQAIIQHLMFKALFELSRDRVAFITRLFSRERPSGLDDAPIQKIWDAVPPGTGTDRDRYLKNRAEIETHLTKVRGIPLTTEDLASLEYVYNAFFTLGPAIDYAGYQTRLTTGNVNFAKLSLAADSTGVLRSFLGSEEISGSSSPCKNATLSCPSWPTSPDLAPCAVSATTFGPEARRSPRSTSRTSNSHLYGMSIARGTDLNGGSKNFYDNLATLPVDSTSVLIRGFSTRYPAFCVVDDFLKAVAAGRVQSLVQAQRCGK